MTNVISISIGASPCCSFARHGHAQLAVNSPIMIIARMIVAAIVIAAAEVSAAGTWIADSYTNAAGTRAFQLYVPSSCSSGGAMKQKSGAAQRDESLEGTPCVT